MIVQVDKLHHKSLCDYLRLCFLPFLTHCYSKVRFERELALAKIITPSWVTFCRFKTIVQMFTS